MKKHIIYIFLALCTPIKNYAQVAWTTSLNYSGGTPLFLGTNDPYPLRIYTNNENRMHINQNLSYGVNSQASIARNGYVGIGRNLTPITIWNAPVK